MSEALQYSIVALIIVAVVVYTIVRIKRHGTRPPCCDCKDCDLMRNCKDKNKNKDK